MLSFAKSKYLSSGETPSLLITSSGYTCNQCVAGQTGLVKMQGFATNTGYLDLTGNSYTRFVAQDVTDNSGGTIIFRNNSLTEVDMRSMTTGGGDFWGNPITSANFDSLVSTDNQQLYIAHNTAMTTPPAFPALVTMNRAIVFSQNLNMTGNPSFPLLQFMYHEVEFDYTKITALSFPSLKIIRHNGALPAGIVAGGDLSDVGGTGKSPLASLYTPNLEELSGLLSINTTSTTAGFDTWTYNTSKFLTLGNHFSINLTRNLLTQTFIDNLLVHLANIASGPYTETGTGSDYTFNQIDLRFQTTGAKPSATGLAAKATLEALNITVLVDP